MSGTYIQNNCKKCGNYLIMPESWNGSAPPIMCDCEKICECEKKCNICGGRKLSEKEEELNFYKKVFREE